MEFEQARATIKQATDLDSHIIIESKTWIVVYLDGWSCWNFARVSISKCQALKSIGSFAKAMQWVWIWKNQPQLSVLMSSFLSM